MARRVLVVDDKACVRKLLVTVLGNRYDVLTASDGATALSMLETIPVDVVITDVRMLQTSGFEVLRALRSRGSTIPVVMLTGYGSIPDAVGAMRLGAFDYVTKPVDAEQISLIVARAVDSLGCQPRTPALAPGPREPPTSTADEADPSGCIDTIEAARDQATLRYLIALMSHCQGNVTRAALRAGITRESLHRLLRHHSIPLERFRSRARPPAEPDEELEPPKATA